MILIHLVSRSNRMCEVLDGLNLSLITRAAETVVAGASYQGDIPNTLMRPGEVRRYSVLAWVPSKSAP